MCLLNLFCGLGEGGRPDVKIACIFLVRLLLGGSNAKEWDDNQKKKFF